MIPKFRAWHKPMQRMSEVLAISYERQKVKIRHLRGTTHMTAPFDDVILMQSTGLLDKNGQEIFEGDVLRGDDGEIFFNEVCFDEKTAKWMRNTDIELWENVELLEIIGNVYQNPELVEGL